MAFTEMNIDQSVMHKNFMNPIQFGFFTCKKVPRNRTKMYKTL